jgi:hypothetical protein
MRTDIINATMAERSPVHSGKMWQSRERERTLPLVFEENGPDNLVETSSLLDSASTSSSNQNQSYDSTEQCRNYGVALGLLENHGLAHEFDLQQQASGGCGIPHDGHRKIQHVAFCTLILAVAVFLFVADSSREERSLVGNAGFSKPGASSVLALSSELVFSSPFVVATATADDDSLSGLAASMLPAFYADMLPRLDMFTKTLVPGEVFKTRKFMLATRDLLDVFSPVYPNTTTATIGLENEDLWGSLRFYLDDGYMVVGDFLDLNHAHVKYSKRQLNHSRNRVLQWHARFRKFREAHDVPAFLAAPTIDSISFHHEKESRLFWKHIHKRPGGGDPATASLQYLGSKQWTCR